MSETLASCGFWFCTYWQTGANDNFSQAALPSFFVDFNAILNLNAWYETTAACNPDGSGCKNLRACGKDGKRPECARLDYAPVCQYVKNQNAGDPSVSLIPGADVISAFSFAMDDDYRVGSSSCASGEYAGCMTAPCYFQEGATVPPQDGDPVQCMCPTWTGEFQIGQLGRERECKIGDGKVHVWSAANKVGGD